MKNTMVRVFELSPLNGAKYEEDIFAPNWQWPSETWFQKKMKERRSQQRSSNATNPKDDARTD